MKKSKMVAAGLSAVVLLEGCAGTPMGPTVQVIPAPNKPFELFQQEDAYCRQFAGQQVSGQADAANEKAVGAALLGAALGAGIGGAAGGGRGAGQGAAIGGAMGTVVGAGSSGEAQHSIQGQYNHAYVQCMYSKGNQVQQPVTVVHPTVVYPAPGVYYAPPPPVIYSTPQPAYTAPPAGYAPPPPPPGSAPPPPAGYAPPPPPPGSAPPR